MQFDEWLKRKRKEYGYTQDDLAIKLNVVRQMVSLYETGKRVPDENSLEIIAGLFNTDRAFLEGLIAAGESDVTEEETVKRKALIKAVMLAAVQGIVVLLHFMLLRDVEARIWLDNTKTVIIRLLMYVSLPASVYVWGKMLAKVLKHFSKTKLPADFKKVIVFCDKYVLPALFVVSYTGFLNFTVMQNEYLVIFNTIAYLLFVKYRYLSYLVITAVSLLSENE